MMFQSVSLASLAAQSVAAIGPVTSIGFVNGLDVKTNSSRRVSLSEVKSSLSDVSSSRESIRYGVGFAGSYVNVSAGAPVGGIVSSTPSPLLVFAFPLDDTYHFVGTARASGQAGSFRHVLSPNTKMSTGGSVSTPLLFPSR